MKLQFDSKKTFYKDPFGAVAEGTAIAFRLEVLTEESELGKTGKNLRVILTVREDGGDERWIWGRMESGKENPDFTERLVFQAFWRPEKSGLYFYRFRVLSSSEEHASTGEFQLTVYRQDFFTPDWLSGGLMYQIFPDRFAKSESCPAPDQHKDYRMHQIWGEMPDSGPDERGIVWNKDFFGGNLRGISDQLPYLESLGVTVIYLNPVFRAFSNHRYDTANFMEIDPMLGTEQDFGDLCGAAMKRNIRIVIDGVFNHTGSHSVYFNKDGAFDTLGAWQSQDSPWYSWYSFSRYPDQYESWWGIDTLPAVNEMEESYRDYIIRGEDSVIKHWMRLGASGVRLDVADELPDPFLDEIRRAVKSVNPQGAVIGEVWEDASSKVAYGQRRRYFQGEQLDSVMNYPLRDWLVDFLNRHRDGAILQDQIISLMENYPRMCAHSLMNILGTHDTERILSVMEQGVSLEKGRQKLFMALLIWAFAPGIPCIYYGDEIGMEGGKDPFNRRCFEPEKKKKDIFTFYRRLLHFRKQISGLGAMDYAPELSGPGYFSFRRTGEKSAVFVYINVSDEPKILSLGLGVHQRIFDFVNCGGISFTDDLYKGNFMEADSGDGVGARLDPCSGVVLFIVGEFEEGSEKE